ncbi:MAG: type IX secretion system protein PorQ [Chitinophagaceae bacterium]|nr:type IX secretion system protein PorQ [Chitinophagaceae bacterium]
MPKSILTSIYLFCLAASPAVAQVVGGQSAMEFLRLPSGPHVSALGGMNVSNADKDISLAMQNPSLMRPGLHNTLGLNQNFYYSGISVSNLQYGYHVPKLETSFLLGVQYLNYGKFTRTDNLGNEMGDFNASDYAITIGASRQYLQKWRYGASLKYAQSTLYDRNAYAALADVGITYMDTASLITIGAVAKNMGVMLKKYNPNNPAEPLPFDVQIGITKRFKYVPLRLIATLHHLYQWDVRYDNPADAQSNNLFGTTEEDNKTKTYFTDKLFRHFIFGAEILLGKRVLVTASYNHLRRSELVIKDKTGMAGFAYGVGIDLNRFQVHYSRSHYHVAGAYNELGLDIALNKLFGIGKIGDKIHWNATYPDWDFYSTPDAADASGN